MSHAVWNWVKLWVNIGTECGILALKIVYCDKTNISGLVLEDAEGFGTLKFKQLEEKKQNINCILMNKLCVEKSWS